MDENEKILRARHPELMRRLAAEQGPEHRDTSQPCDACSRPVRAGSRNYSWLLCAICAEGLDERALLALNGVYLAGVRRGSSYVETAQEQTQRLAIELRQAIERWHLARATAWMLACCFLVAAGSCLLLLVLR